MKKNIILILVLSVAGLAASSCIVAIVDTSDPGRFPGLGEFRRTLPFQAGGTVLLESSGGDIEIYGWDRSEVEVVARSAGSLQPGFYWFGFPGWNEARSRVSVDRFDDLIKIKTRAEEGSDKGLDFLLNVPVSVNLNPIHCREGHILLSGVYGKAVLDLRKGDVRVENFSGSLDASLGRGKAEVELLDLRKGDEVRIISTAGDIVLYLEKNASARVEASSSLGRVECDFDLGQKPADQKIKGQLGDGKALVSLAAVQGRISIKKIQD
ncbi:MAG: DUF4097 family beta strand repeat-containing protein [Candidatus Aminicenantales bacterium]